MAQQTINIGTTVNDGTGDSLRSAFIKINTNFDSLFTNSVQGPSFGVSGDDLIINGNLTVTGSVSHGREIQPANVIVSPPASVQDYEFTDGSFIYHSVNSTSDITVNFTSLSELDVYSTITYTILLTNGATAYKITDFQADGTVSGVTTMWLNGSVPSGTINSIAKYSITVFKTASTPAYTILASAEAYL